MAAERTNKTAKASNPTENPVLSSVSTKEPPATAKLETPNNISIPLELPPSHWFTRANNDRIHDGRSRVRMTDIRRYKELRKRSGRLSNCSADDMAILYLWGAGDEIPLQRITAVKRFFNTSACMGLPCTGPNLLAEAKVSRDALEQVAEVMADWYAVRIGGKTGWCLWKTLAWLQHITATYGA